MGGSGSVPLTNESERPKNFLWIRLRNTAVSTYLSRKLKSQQIAKNDQSILSHLRVRVPEHIKYTRSRKDQDKKLIFAKGLKSLKALDTRLYLNKNFFMVLQYRCGTDLHQIRTNRYPV
jgi:hypothetical protein